MTNDDQHGTAPAETKGKIRLLLLEDSQMDAELLAAQLHRGGIAHELQRVDTRDGFQAELERGGYDLILSDYLLPEFDGLAALEMAGRLRPQVPVIIVSGVLGEEVAAETFRMGAADYVLKNRLSRVVPAIQHALQQAQDRQQRLRAEADLQEAREIFQMIVESARGYAIFTTDLEGRVTTWNMGAELLTGYRESEILHQPADLIFTSEDQAQSRFAQEREQALREGKAEDDRWHQRKDGTRFLASGQVMPLRHGGELPRGFVKIMRDITERQKTEEERAQHLRDLARSNSELKEFAYAASHDLREPLRTIASYSQLLVRTVNERVTDRERPLLDYILSGVRRMSHLLDDLQQFLEAGEMEDDGALPQDSAAALNRVLKHLKPVVERTGAEITVAPLPFVRCPSSQLLLLFCHLLDNALKYRGESAPVISISAAPENGHWRFCFRDQGPGIEPEFQEQVFGVFKRLHGSQVPGTGIGLAVCKRIVQRYGGRIWVESNPGQGAAFFFTLPA